MIFCHKQSIAVKENCDINWQQLSLHSREKSMAEKELMFARVWTCSIKSDIMYSSYSEFEAILPYGSEVPYRLENRCE